MIIIIKVLWLHSCMKMVGHYNSHVWLTKVVIGMFLRSISQRVLSWYHSPLQGFHYILLSPFHLFRVRILK